MLIENAEYNFKQDITKYFGKEIIVIYSGYGGYGWNHRILVGEYKDSPGCFEVRDNDNTPYLLAKVDWYCKIILPENFDKMTNYFKPANGSAPTIIVPKRID